MAFQVTTRKVPHRMTTFLRGISKILGEHRLVWVKLVWSEWGVRLYDNRKRRKIREGQLVYHHKRIARDTEPLPWNSPATNKSVTDGAVSEKLTRTWQCSRHIIVFTLCLFGESSTFDILLVHLKQRDKVSSRKSQMIAVHVGKNSTRHRHRGSERNEGGQNLHIGIQTYILMTQENNDID